MRLKERLANHLFTQNTREAVKKKAQQSVALAETVFRNPQERALLEAVDIAEIILTHFAQLVGAESKKRFDDTQAFREKLPLLIADTLEEITTLQLIVFLEKRISLGFIDVGRENDLDKKTYNISAKDNAFIDIVTAAYSICFQLKNNPIIQGKLKSDTLPAALLQQYSSLAEANLQEDELQEKQDQLLDDIIYLLNIPESGLFDHHLFTNDANQADRTVFYQKVLKRLVDGYWPTYRFDLENTRKTAKKVRAIEFSPPISGCDLSANILIELVTQPSLIAIFNTDETSKENELQAVKQSIQTLVTRATDKNPTVIMPCFIEALKAIIVSSSNHDCDKYISFVLEFFCKSQPLYLSFLQHLNDEQAEALVAFIAKISKAENIPYLISFPGLFTHLRVSEILTFMANIEDERQTFSHENAFKQMATSMMIPDDLQSDIARLLYRNPKETIDWFMAEGASDDKHAWAEALVATLSEHELSYIIENSTEFHRLIPQLREQLFELFITQSALYRKESLVSSLFEHYENAKPLLENPRCFDALATCFPEQFEFDAFISVLLPYYQQTDDDTVKASYEKVFCNATLESPSRECNLSTAQCCLQSLHDHAGDVKLMQLVLSKYRSLKALIDYLPADNQFEALEKLVSDENLCTQETYLELIEALVQFHDDVDQRRLLAALNAALSCVQSDWDRFVSEVENKAVTDSLLENRNTDTQTLWARLAPDTQNRMMCSAGIDVGERLQEHSIAVWMLSNPGEHKLSHLELLQTLAYFHDDDKKLTSLLDLIASRFECEAAFSDVIRHLCHDHDSASAFVTHPLLQCLHQDHRLYLETREQLYRLAGDEWIQTQDRAYWYLLSQQVKLDQLAPLLTYTQFKGNNYQQGNEAIGEFTQTYGLNLASAFLIDTATRASLLSLVNHRPNEHFSTEQQESLMFASAIGQHETAEYAKLTSDSNLIPATSVAVIKAWVETLSTSGQHKPLESHEYDNFVKVILKKKSINVTEIVATFKHLAETNKHACIPEVFERIANKINIDKLLADDQAPDLCQFLCYWLIKLWLDQIRSQTSQRSSKDNLDPLRLIKNNKTLTQMTVPYLFCLCLDESNAACLPQIFDAIRTLTRNDLSKLLQSNPNFPACIFYSNNKRLLLKQLGMDMLELMEKFDSWQHPNAQFDILVAALDNPKLLERIVSSKSEKRPALAALQKHLLTPSEDPRFQEIQRRVGIALPAEMIKLAAYHTETSHTANPSAYWVSLAAQDPQFANALFTPSTVDALKAAQQAKPVEDIYQPAYSLMTDGSVDPRQAQRARVVAHINENFIHLAVALSKFDGDFIRNHRDIILFHAKNDHAMACAIIQDWRHCRALFLPKKYCSSDAENQSLTFERFSQLFQPFFKIYQSAKSSVDSIDQIVSEAFLYFNTLYNKHCVQNQTLSNLDETNLIALTRITMQFEQLPHQFSNMQNIVLLEQWKRRLLTKPELFKTMIDVDELKQYLVSNQALYWQPIQEKTLDIDIAIQLICLDDFTFSRKLLAEYPLTPEHVATLLAYHVDHPQKDNPVRRLFLDKQIILLGEDTPLSLLWLARACTRAQAIIQDNPTLNTLLEQERQEASPKKHSPTKIGAPQPYLSRSSSDEGYKRSRSLSPRSPSSATSKSPTQPQRKSARRNLMSEFDAAEVKDKLEETKQRVARIPGSMAKSTHFVELSQSFSNSHQVLCQRLIQSLDGCTNSQVLTETINAFVENHSIYTSVTVEEVKRLLADAWDKLEFSHTVSRNDKHGFVNSIFAEQLCEKMNQYLTRITQRLPSVDGLGDSEVKRHQPT